jgi:hypothetical protein
LLRHQILSWLAHSITCTALSYLGQCIIAPPPFYLGQRITAAPQFLSLLAHHCHAAISISYGALSLCRRSVLASASLPCHNFYLGRRIITAPPYPITASASLPRAMI